MQRVRFSFHYPVSNSVLQNNNGKPFFPLRHLASLNSPLNAGCEPGGVASHCVPTSPESGEYVSPMNASVFFFLNMVYYVYSAH